MAFCTKCGKSIADGAKFCGHCGAAVATNDFESDSQRKTVFEGEIHKCPNCGEILKSFEATCPACGCEIRSVKATSSVRELGLRLEAVEASREDVSKRIGNKRVSAREKQSIAYDIESKINDQKATLIRTFPIPTTKEDLFEFLVLAYSNINLKSDAATSEAERDISDAWEAKFEQAYEKARLSFGHTQEFEKVQALYKKKKGEIKQRKKKSAYFWIGFLAIFLLPIVLLVLNPPSTDPVYEAENERLKVIAEEAYEALADENYVLARAKAASLTYLESHATYEKQWDKTRSELLALIDAAENGAEVDIPETNESSSSAGDESTEPNQMGNAAGSSANILRAESDLEITKAEYYISNEYLSYAIHIHNNSTENAVQYPAFRITARDASNGVLGTGDQVLNIIYPGEDYVWGGLAFSVADTPATVDFEMLKPEDYNVEKASSLDHTRYIPLEVQGGRLQEDEWFPKFLGEVYNPNDYRIEQAVVCVVIRNAEENIVGSELTFISDLAANGRVPFELTLSGNTDFEHFEIYAHSWD
jgi:predicted  nucleic acid-binding Zn-ribbon protein